MFIVLLLNVIVIIKFVGLFKWLLLLLRFMVYYLILMMICCFFDEVSLNYFDVDGCGVGWLLVGVDFLEGRMRSLVFVLVVLR